MESFQPLDLMIPTHESIGREYVMQLLLRHGKSVLLTGASGTGDYFRGRLYLQF